MQQLLFVWVATQLRERSERNKNPPAMRVEDKKVIQKASFPLILRMFKPVEKEGKDA